MATYIAGVTDYIPSLQPFQPDLNFYANVMQTRQSRYDAAKTQINNLYGSLLNSPLSRDTDIKRREEFFKAIDQDIKKISGLDLSLQQNSDAALNVFKGFYEDKYMMDDMVKTKKYRSQMEKAEMLKACNNPEKCPGYWDEGVEYLQYKMEEYKNLSDDEALNYDIGTYDSYTNWKKDAFDKISKMNYKVERDKISGNYIVHDENGVLIKEGLEGLLQNIYGDDPKIKSNYETLAYVNRKRAAKQGAPIYGSEEEAEKNYMLKNLNQGLNDTKKKYKYYTDNYDEVNSAILKLEQKKKKGLTEAEQQAYDYAVSMRDNLGGLVKYYQNNISELEGDIRSDNIDLLRRRSDAAQLTNLRANDIDGLATSLSKIGEKHLIKADEFKLISARGAEERATVKYRNQLDTQMEKLKSDLRIRELDRNWGFKFTFEEYKNALESGQIPSKDGSSKTSKSKTIAENLKTKTDLKTAEPGSDVSINIKDNPDAVYVRNLTEMQTLGDKARQANSQVLYEFFNAAKSEYLKNNKDPLRSFGAVKYLNLFGDNWNNIKSYSDFEKALGNSKIKSSAGELFSEMVRISNMNSNPGGDNAWMKSFIDANPEYIDQAKTSQEAAESYTATMLNTNKKAAEKLTQESNSDVAKYLLTNNGLIDTEENFYLKVEKHAKNNPDFDPSDVDYEDLLEEFYKTYNKMGGVALNAGEGLSQESEEAYNIKGYGYKFSTLDPNAKTKEFNNTYETLKSAIEDPETKIVIGDNTEEALGNFDEADNEILKGFLSQLYNKAMTSKKDDSDRPILNGQINAFAANNENLSSLTLSSISNEFLKPYIGTSENPGILYDKDLSKITVFFNNKKVETPFNLGKGLSDLQLVLKTRGSKKVDVFDDFDVNYTYLDNDKVSVDLDYYEYDLTTGQKVYNNNEPIEVSFDAIDDVNSTLIQSLKTTRDNNKAVEIAKYLAKIAKENK